MLRLSLHNKKTLQPKQRWQRIQDFSFPPLFLELFCKKQKCDRSFAFRVIEEYKRFMYLATYLKVTPSLIIDEIWHLHIQWTSLYAEFCQDIYNDNFCHHSPEFILLEGKVSRFQDQYHETLKHYYWEFDCHPPQDIWSYYLLEEIQLKLRGRNVPISTESFWRTLKVVFSPVYSKVVLKAKNTQHEFSNSFSHLKTKTNEAQILNWQLPEGFADRLAKEQGWSKIFAQRATCEYLKFQFLKWQGLKGVSPVLEQVWLLHLLATKNYLEFSQCMGLEIIHYIPGDRTSWQWSDLVYKYKNAFKSMPAKDIWKSDLIKIKLRLITDN